MTYVPHAFLRGLAFDLTVEGEHTPAESHPIEKPLIFRPGQGEILPAIETRMVGAAFYEERVFSLAPEEAYGRYHPDAQTTFSRSAFDARVKLEPGARVTACKPDGTFARMQIVAVAGDYVVVDLNHPWAGRSLFVRARYVPIPLPAATAQYVPLPRGEHLH